MVKEKVFQFSGNEHDWLLFATWCTATCRQRIEANGFNATSFILLKQTERQFNSIMHILYINYIILVLKKSGSLCSRWSFFITPELPVSPCPSLCCLCPPWALTAYLPYLLGDRPLSPPPPSWPHFPQVPGNTRLPCWAQLQLRRLI